MIRKVKNPIDLKFKDKWNISKKEYPELTFDQVKLVAKYQNDGLTEEEALAKVKETET